MFARRHPLLIRHRSAQHLLALVPLLFTACLSSAAAEPARVFRSSDGGRSWSRSDQGLDGNSRINALGSAGDAVLAGTDSGIFISLDQGQSWRDTGSRARNAGRVVAFAAVERKIYAATDRTGVLESSDQGMTWAVNEAFPSKNVRSLLRHREELYAGTDAEGVLLSKDDGCSWEQIRQGLPDEAQVFALAVLKGRVFAGLYSNGLYRWEDEKQRWKKTGSVVPLVLASLGDTLVAGHNPGGIYTSDDLGATWSKATFNTAGDLTLPMANQRGESPTDPPVWALASGPGLVFAGAGSGFYYSENTGRTWTRARNGLAQESPGVAFLINGDLVLAATAGGSR